MAGNGTLTRRQRRALRELLRARTIAEAAAAARVGERTLYRYLADETFQAALKLAEADAINAAARRLIAEGGDALDVLSQLMKTAESESVRRQAASHWLESILRWRELMTLENRLIELEALYYGKKS